MAADSYLNVLGFFDSIFKGSPRSVSSTNGTVETFFYDWVSLSYFIFYLFIFLLDKLRGGVTYPLLKCLAAPLAYGRRPIAVGLKTKNVHKVPICHFGLFQLDSLTFVKRKKNSLQ